MTKHRMSKTPEYQAWHHAKRRCNDPSSRDYKDYGAKGIKVSPLWESDFLMFFQELGPRPTPQHSLDRIDGAKGYVPGNVRWATKEQQAQNRPGFVRLIVHNDQAMTVAEWARATGIPAPTLYNRMNREQPPATVLSPVKAPTGTPPRILTCNGKTNSLKGWARVAGLKPTTLRERLKRGWTLEHALTHQPEPRYWASSHPEKHGSETACRPGSSSPRTG